MAGPFAFDGLDQCFSSGDFYWLACQLSEVCEIFSNLTADSGIVNSIYFHQEIGLTYYIR